MRARTQPILTAQHARSWRESLPLLSLPSSPIAEANVGTRSCPRCVPRRSLHGTLVQSSKDKLAGGKGTAAIAIAVQQTSFRLCHGSTINANASAVPVFVSLRCPRDHIWWQIKEYIVLITICIYGNLHLYVVFVIANPTLCVGRDVPVRLPPAQH